MTVKDVKGKHAVWVGPFGAEPTRPRINTDSDGGHWIEFDGGLMSWGSTIVMTDRLGPYSEKPDVGRVEMTHGVFYWLVFEDSVPAWAEPFVALGVFYGWLAVRFADLMGAESGARLERLKIRGLNAAIVDEFDRYRCAGRSLSSYSAGKTERSGGKIHDVRMKSAIEELEAREGVKVYHVAEREEDGESIIDCLFVARHCGWWGFEDLMLEEGHALVYRIDPANPADALMRLACIDVTDGCVVVESSAPVTGWADLTAQA